MPSAQHQLSTQRAVIRMPHHNSLHKSHPLHLTLPATLPAFSLFLQVKGYLKALPRAANFIATADSKAVALWQLLPAETPHNELWAGWTRILAVSPRKVGCCPCGPRGNPGRLCHLMRSYAVCSAIIWVPALHTCRQLLPEFVQELPYGLICQPHPSPPHNRRHPNTHINCSCTCSFALFACDSNDRYNFTVGPAGAP